MPRRLSLALACALACACAPALIPGSHIPDTADDRALLAVLRDYKNAFETKDAKAIVALASPRYLDERQSISYSTLENKLASDFAHVKDVHLDVNVRSVEVHGNTAYVDYFYSEDFILNTVDATWHRTSDDKRMTLVREPRAPHGWFVTSGF